MGTFPLRSLVQPALIQLRRLWLPFVALQIVGLAIVVAYFNWPAFAQLLARVTEWKHRGGVPFTAAALAFACGVLPEVFKTITGVDRTFSRSRASFLAHNIVLFGVIGIVQDFFYRWLGYQFGDGRAIVKTAIDQFVYSTLFSVPLIAFSFTLRRHGYSFARAYRAVDRCWYVREVVPVLVVNMAYWWPMGLLMYTLPPTMTFVYGATAAAASATLITAVANRSRDETAPEQFARCSG